MTLAVLCPGQGAQHPAMLDLALAHAEGRRVLEAAATALSEHPRLWLTDTDAMFANANAQPLICAAQLAQWAVLRRALPVPRAFAGYSVGELACYGLADAVDAGMLAQLARQRADAMDESAARQPGGLIALRGLARNAVVALCAGLEGHVAIAIADDAFVVGGTEAALAAFLARARSHGAQVTCLRVGIASHTPLLASAVAPFRATLERSPLRAPSVPIVAGIDAEPVTTRERAIATLAAQVAQTVEWAQCLDALYERGCRVYLELGPGHALSRMASARFDDVDARAVDDFSSVAAVTAWAVKQRD